MGAIHDRHDSIMLVRQHVSINDCREIRWSAMDLEYLASRRPARRRPVTIADPQRPTHIGSLLRIRPRCWPALAAAGVGQLCAVTEHNVTWRALAADVQALMPDRGDRCADRRALLDGFRPRGRRGSLIPRHRGGLNWWLVTALSPISRHDGSVHDDLHVRHRRKSQQYRCHTNKPRCRA